MNGYCLYSIFVMRSNICILIQNIRSMRANFDTFNLYVASLDEPPDLIFLTEIWIYSNECSEYSLPNYDFRTCCSDSYRAGGAGVFIHRDFLNFSLQYCNWISADLLILDIKFAKYNWTFICVYRFHNRDIPQFCKELEDLLQARNTKNIAILGDININLLDINDSLGYQTILASYGFESLINEPTRMESCLDHVFVKCENYFEFKTCNLPMHFSDHNLIVMNITASSIKPICLDNSSSNFRINYKYLNDRLKDENWNSVYSQNSCNSGFEFFFIQIHDQYSYD